MKTQNEPTPEELLRNLTDTSSNEESRLQAIQHLVELINFTDIPNLAISQSFEETLIKALNDDSLNIRLEAARALGEIKAASAVENLLKTLKVEDWQMRYWAVRSLSKIGDLQVMNAILDCLLNDPDEVVRKGAAFGLKEIGEPEIITELAPEVIMVLTKALNDSNLDVRQTSIQTLVSFGKLAVPALLQAFKEGNSEVRGLAAEGLGNIGSKQAVEPLIEALASLETEEGETGYIIIETLGKLGDKRAVEPLIQLLEEETALQSNVDDNQKDDIFSGVIASALVKLGDGRAIEPLIRALEGPEPKLVCYALGRIGGESAIAPLVRLAESTENDDAIWALALLGNIAVESLISFLNSPDDDMRSDAAEALGRVVDDRAIGPLVNLMQNDEWEWTRRAAAYALSCYETLPDSAFEPLFIALQSEDKYLRYHAAVALGKLGDERALERLQWLKQHDKSYLTEGPREWHTIKDAAGEAIRRITLFKGKQE